VFSMVCVSFHAQTPSLGFNGILHFAAKTEEKKIGLLEIE